METNLIKELNSVLKLFPEFWEGETLLRSKVIDALKAKEPKLIKALIGSEKIKQNYSTDIDGVLIFDFDKLIGLLRFKEYWPDSFTKYRNKIGLTSSGKYLDYDTDVVLSFPFKDCILEGGMTKEEQGKDEVYYNEIIARDEIDRLFSPKVFTNSKRYTKDGVEENITEFKDDDNLIIKGNNLIALHSLKKRFAGKINLIYIDPPYNIGDDGFEYNDRFNHSSWLVFMKNRLEIARELLSEDGAIFISLDDTEFAYLRVLMDSIFGAGNFVNTFIRQSKIGGGSDSSYGAKEHEYILVFAKDKSKLREFFIDFDQKYLKRYKNEDNFGKFFWDTLARPGLNNPIFYDITLPDGSKTNQGWIWSEERFHNELKEGNIKFSQKKNGTWSVQFKQRLNDKGRRPRTLLTNLGGTSAGNKEIKNLFGGRVFKYPKSERLIKFLLSLYTKKNDLILDFYLGSGTTAAVAHKMARRYIGIEQMDYINDITVPRLQKVIGGEQGGISKDVKWQGGGSFVYTELKQLNAAFIQAIDAASGYDELTKLFDIMKLQAHLNYQVELDSVLTAEYEVPGVDHKVGFKDLILDKQKCFLVELLDKNQLYVNASEMDDATFDIPENDKAFTKSFYGAA